MDSDGKLEDIVVAEVVSIQCGDRRKHVEQASNPWNTCGCQTSLSPSSASKSTNWTTAAHSTFTDLDQKRIRFKPSEHAPPTETALLVAATRNQAGGLLSDAKPDHVAHEVYEKNCC
ncbi:hypothetical protein HYFRA_00003660 [Hymenoscyphus fraxineus]|uniref:Uncharacterized protein n=1 Tax=Hymenoscyphus fraxineus TaxID=746836 RepID=A0A9N9L231_9HELO|nr:hypothetical protein HYFRA_00003660 [Hymenoscyphus fraxineus]